MCCIAEIAITVYGIIALITGKIAFSRNRYCYGVPARISGAILAATFPLALMIGMIIGVAIGVTNPAALQEGNLGGLQVTALLGDTAVVVVCLAGGLGVALAYAEPKRKPKVDIDEGYDEPFRSRRDDDRDERQNDEGITGDSSDFPPRQPDDRIQE